MLTSLSCFVVMTACKVADASDTYKEVASLDAFVKELRIMLSDESVDSLHIEVTDSHDGRVTVSSDIVKTDKGVRLRSWQVDRQGVRSDTTMILSRHILDARIAEYSAGPHIVLGGHYQHMSISNNDYTYNFASRRAFGLLSVFIDGRPTRAEVQERQINHTN